MFSDRIKDLRTSSNLTQKELAQKLNVTSACISSWEKGRTEPNMGIIENLSVVFGCSKAYLLGENKNKGINKENLSKTKENLYLSDTEIEIIKAYRQCVPELQFAIMDMLHVPFKKESELSSKAI